MNNLLKIKTLFFLFLTPLLVSAQEVEMADSLRANGKIYVVVSVLSIIVVGLFAYLFYLDSKLSKKEKLHN